MSSLFDLDKLNAAADRAEAAMDGEHGEIYKELRALTPEQIDDITPDTRDQREYECLMEVVQQATEKNIDQAELVERVKALGAVAIKIAKRVPTLAPFMPDA